MKKVFLGFILSAIFWLMLAGTGAAEELIISKGITTGADYVTLQSLSQANKKAAMEDIKEALEGFKESVSVSKYNLTPAEAGDLYLETVYENPQLFYVKTEWAHSTFPATPDKAEQLIFIGEDESEEKVLYSYAEYIDSPAALAERKEKIEAELHRILAIVNKDMTDAEKALAVHDWFVQHYQYNYAASLTSALCEAHRIDGLFIDKTAVCQGYALGYQYVMQKLGIPSKYLPSESMGHAWNLLKIGDAWYHVDVTYDDPVYDGEDIFGYVSHDCFLRSDAGIQAEDHNGWSLPDGVNEVSSTDFGGEDRFWANLTTGAQYLDGEWYYKKSDSIVKRGFKDESEKKVKRVSQTYFDIGIYEGRIYYNTLQDVRSIKPDGTDERIVWTPTLSKNTEIYKMLLLGDTIYIGTAKEYDLILDRQKGITLVDNISFIAEVEDGQVVITMTGRTDKDGMFALSIKDGKTQDAFTCIPLAHGHELFKIDIPTSTQKEVTVYAWSGLMPLAKPVTISLEE